MLLTVYRKLHKSAEKKGIITAILFFKNTPVILKLVICLIAGINGLHKMQICQRALLVCAGERLLLFSVTEIQLTS